MTRYVEAIGQAIRAAGGTISLTGTDTVQALFGLKSGARRGAVQALEAAHAIDKLTGDLDERIGRRSRMRVTVTIHAGRAVVGEVDAVERPAIMAIGDAIDQLNEIRRAIFAHGQRFAISQPVYAMVGIEPVSAEEIRVPLPSSTDSVVVLLSAAPPESQQNVQRSGSERVRSALQRIWSGRQAEEAPVGVTGVQPLTLQHRRKSSSRKYTCSVSQPCRQLVAARTAVAAARALSLRAPHGDVLRHCILPRAVRELTLAGTIGVHDEDRCIGLERVVVERGFVPPLMP